MSVLEQQGSHIGIRAEARTLIAQRIRYKHIAVLAAQLALGVIEKVLRLHRKAAQQLSRLFVLAERGEDIRIAGQLDIHLAVTLFELFIRSLRRTVITDGGSLDDEILLGCAARHRVVHIPRGNNIHARDTVRRIERGRSGNERCVSAAHGCAGRDRVTHFAGGVVGQEPNRVHGLLCRAGGNKNVPACQILLGQRLFNAPEERGRVRQLAASAVAAGEVACVRLDDVEAALSQRSEVLLRHWIVIHTGVHRGSDNDRRLGGKQRGRHHVVRDAVRRLGDDVSGRRCDHEHVSRLRERNVLHLPRKAAVERIHDRAVAGQCFKRHRRDKLGRGLGHQHMDSRAVLVQLAGEIGSFIGRNAARHAQNDRFPCKTHGLEVLLRNVTVAQRAVVKLVQAAHLVRILILVLVSLGVGVLLILIQIKGVVHVNHSGCNGIVLRNGSLHTRTRTVNDLAGCDLIERQLNSLVRQRLALFLCLIGNIAGTLRCQVYQQIAVAYSFHQFLHRRVQHSNQFSLFTRYSFIL